MPTSSKCAASISTFTVASETSVAAPPMTPATPMAPEPSVISRSSGSRLRTLPSRVFSVSPGLARRTTMSPESLSRS